MLYFDLLTRPKMPFQGDASEGSDTFWEGSLTPPQRCSWSILQPQPTGWRYIWMQYFSRLKPGVSKINGKLKADRPLALVEPPLGGWAASISIVEHWTPSSFHDIIGQPCWAHILYHVSPCATTGPEWTWEQ